MAINRPVGHKKTKPIKANFEALLLPADGLDDCLFGLICRGAVGIILAQLGVNGFGFFQVFQAARGDYLAGEDFGDVIITQLQVFKAFGQGKRI